MSKVKDWTGNSVSYSKTLGASSHSENERETHDFYATEPKAVKFLLEMEKFNNTIWECACGQGHLSDEMKRLGYNVFSSDIIERGYADLILDFIGIDNNKETEMDIITNPPYRYANDFILKAMQILKNGNKLALFLPIRYLEGKERKQIFKTFPPKVVYVSSSRLKCAINAEFDKMACSAVSYAWFVWEKGFKDTTQLKWFN